MNYREMLERPHVIYNSNHCFHLKVGHQVKGFERVKKERK